MLKRFNPIIERPQAPFCEDIYLIDKRGRVLACRQGIQRNFNSLFSIIEREEIEFIDQNALLSSLHPFLAVKSSEGLMIIDNSLFFDLNVLIAIIPHFSTEQVLSVIETEVKRMIFPSLQVSSLLDCAGKTEPFFEGKSLNDKLRALYNSPSLCSLHGKTNAEIADIMFDIAHDISAFVGCDIEINVHGVGVFEMKNEISIPLYKYMMLSLFFAARNYSDSRGAVVDIYFDEIGASVGVSFYLSQEYCDINLTSDAPELIDLIRQAKINDFNIDIGLREGILSARGYPWRSLHDDGHLKKKPGLLNYENIYDSQ